MGMPIEDYIRRIERQDLPRLRSALAPLEAKTMRLWSGPSQGTRTEITADEIAMLKRAIATFEEIVQHLNTEYKLKD